MCWLSSDLIAASVAAGFAIGDRFQQRHVVLYAPDLLACAVAALAGIDQVGDAGERVHGRVLRRWIRRAEVVELTGINR